MLKLLVATRNPGKMKEIGRILKGRPLELRSLDEEGIGEEAEENEPTFEGNAVSKALFYSERSDLLTVAEDSGLEVDAMDGRPGVRSARYGGPGLDDTQRYRRVLDELRGVPPEQRSARFVCWLALAREGRLLETFLGAVEGVILDAPRGEGGFGYDPVFFIPELDRTTAQLSLEEKNRISHRGKAFRRLGEYLVS